MLIFDRPEFKGGVMIVRETVDEKGADGQVSSRVYETYLKPSDKGKTFSFKDEDTVLKRYPLFFRKA